MGDARYERTYEALLRARDRGAAIHALGDEQIVEALAASGMAHDALLSNVLATEVMNRVHRLRSALAHLGEGIVVLGIDGAMLWMNPAAEKLLGVSWSDAMLKPFHDLIEHLDPEGEPLPESILDRAARGATHAGDGDRFRIKHGVELCVSYTSAPIRDRDGAPEGVVLAFQDCSERKRSERTLREGRERYKVLFDRSDLGIVSVAVDGTVLDVNSAAERLTQRSFEETEGRPWGDFVHPDDLPRVMQHFAQVRGGAEIQTRVRLLHRDGHYVDVEARGIPIVVDGEVVGLHGILRPLEPG